MTLIELGRDFDVIEDEALEFSVSVSKKRSDEKKQIRTIHTNTDCSIGYENL